MVHRKKKVGVLALERLVGERREELVEDNKVVDKLEVQHLLVAEAVERQPLQQPLLAVAEEAAAKLLPAAEAAAAEQLLRQHLALLEEDF